jgi:hypothetical protein
VTSSLSSATFSAAAEILTKEIGPPTAPIMERIADMDETSEVQSDEALAAVDSRHPRDHGRARKRQE